MRKKEITRSGLLAACGFAFLMGNVSGFVGASDAHADSKAVCSTLRTLDKHIKPGRWTDVIVRKADRLPGVCTDPASMPGDGSIHPTENGWGYASAWVSIKHSAKSKGHATRCMVRFVRNPDGAQDETGATSAPTGRRTTKFSTTWQFYMRTSTPLGVQVWCNGTKTVLLSTLEFKVSQ